VPDAYAAPVSNERKLKHVTKPLINPRPEVASAPLDAHGALNYAELEQLDIDPDEVIDFSVSCNPYGPSPHVREAVARVLPDRYPDRECLALRRALSERHRIPVEQIVCGNGAAELLWLVAFAFIRPADRVLVLGPTFGEYARYAALAGAQVEEIRAGPEREYVMDTIAVEDRLRRTFMRLVFICNPNNPTGTVTQPETIVDWALSHPATLFIVDEAYIQFCPNLASPMAADIPNLLAIRSMTKDYALAGLRLGYAVGSRRVITALINMRPPWSVNAVAQAAGLAALLDDQYLQTTLARLHADREDLIGGLKAAGLHPVPSRLHYFIVNVGDAAGFRARLLRHRIQVRDCASFGLPSHIRIATRRPEENGRLLQAIREVLNEGNVVGNGGQIGEILPSCGGLPATDEHSRYREEG
jgi:histidinol-phosphate aminotransferase